MRAVTSTTPIPLWAACSLTDDRCWRWDDGSLLVDHNENGLVVPLEPPKPKAAARLSASAPRRITLPDGQAKTLTIKVRNRGKGPAYWVRLIQERDPGDPLLFTPPPTRVVLHPKDGRTELIGKVSYLGAANDPTGSKRTLRLHLLHAHGDPKVIKIPVSLELAEPKVSGPRLVQRLLRQVEFTVDNQGAQDLAQFEVRAELHEPDLELARITHPGIAKGDKAIIALPALSNLELTDHSRLDLEIRTLSHPLHRWRFNELKLMQESAQ
jgi:hypothetical protein